MNLTQISTSLRERHCSIINIYRAINFVDATKHGFRIVLLDAFLDSYLAPIQIPTLFITAVPLKSDEKAITKVFYPDNIREDKQVTTWGVFIKYNKQPLMLENNPWSWMHIDCQFQGRVLVKICIVFNRSNIIYIHVWNYPVTLKGIKFWVGKFTIEYSSFSY